jgi:hypothetical protein
MLYNFVQLDPRDVAASETLRAALGKVESSQPGVGYDLVLGIVRRRNNNSSNHVDLIGGTKEDPGHGE